MTRKVCAVCRCDKDNCHPLPLKTTAPERRKLWLESLAIDESHLRPRVNYICGEHFSSSNFDNGVLRHDALPVRKVAQTVHRPSTCAGSADDVKPQVCGVVVKSESEESTNFNPLDIVRQMAQLQDRDRDMDTETVATSQANVTVKQELKTDPGFSGGSDSALKRELEEETEEAHSPKLVKVKEEVDDNMESDQSAEVSSTSRSSDRVGECSVCLQPYSHPIKLPCGHIFCYLCAKGFTSQHGRCAFCRAAVPRNYMNIPELMSELDVRDDRVDTKYMWFYEGRNGWWQFEERLSDELEETLQAGETTEYDLLIAGFMYTIDFTRMIQFRKDRPQRIRRIKRDLFTSPSKGIAGISNDLIQGRII